MDNNHRQLWDLPDIAEIPTAPPLSPQSAVPQNTTPDDNTEPRPIQRTRYRGYQLELLEGEFSRNTRPSWDVLELARETGLTDEQVRPSTAWRNRRGKSRREQIMRNPPLLLHAPSARETSPRRCFEPVTEIVPPTKSTDPAPAFLQMLENPLAASQWLNDPETGPILMQVSRIYQMRLDGNQISTTTDPSPVASPAASLTLASSPTTSTRTSSSSPPAPFSQLTLVLAPHLNHHRLWSQDDV
ncbi:uncharacterized protein LOC112575402 isoform X1 [Pomacea canaliculata]|uniref:uncharacterized protein LOC112575402 isoform X1 n=1 Tax=Pomacea canaliculata TaxID=400727 RepID=UPI000D72AA9D|nr:uncharacterized protein LOC112575402 isoform X1 [Pomacea canaliculata]